MSHHGIHMITGLVPIERPLKIEQKRRRRKTSSSDSDPGDADEIDDSGRVANKGAFSPVTATATLSAGPANTARASTAPAQSATSGAGARSPLTAAFNPKAMGVLLQAQERKRPDTKSS